MGRTDPTFRTLLEAIESRWADYRRALRRRDRPAFDRLFEHAHAHADAAGYLNADDPMDPVLVSMLVEHERRLAELEDRLEAADADADRCGVSARARGAGTESGHGHGHGRGDADADGDGHARTRDRGRGHRDDRPAGE